MKFIAPWVNYYREVEALFEQDPEVKVIFDEEKTELKVYVDNARKADAIAQLLPEEKTFGNVTLKIFVVPSNNAENKTKADLIEEAFFGNPALRYVFRAESVIGKFNYAVFENRVVQYYSDNMSDINGNRSTLYQDIALDVFGEGNDLFYCTEAGTKELSKPLGEWP